MTAAEWKSRCIDRIYREVKKAGELRIRELKRRTHYNRGPQDDSIPCWYEALDCLERQRVVSIERDRDGSELSVRCHHSPK